MELVKHIHTLLSIVNVILDNYDAFNSDLSIDDEVFVTEEYESPLKKIDAANELANNRFPQDFYFGVSSSAYQTEGAWNVSDKGESVFDYMLHMQPDLIIDKSNGDISSDFYHKYEEDIRLAKSIGSNMYRISLSWSRILPNGYSNYVSEDGIRYYNSVIDEMLLNGIEPMITLFHWDLPYPLQKLGGWTNMLMSTWFSNYAKVAFAAFGDRVKYWTTINDPTGLCALGYGKSNTVPGLTPSGITDYLCGLNVLLAHASVYRMYADTYQAQQKGKVGISFTYKWFEPDRNDSGDDVLAAERAYQWHNEWMTHPIFSKRGDYPDMMKDIISKKSFVQDFSDSRLPTLSQTEIEFIQGTADFLGINFYSAVIVRATESPLNIVSFNNDADFVEVRKDIGSEESDSQNTPWALRKLLRRLNNIYMLPDIFITENGYADDGRIADVGRLTYHEQHLEEVLKAMQEGINIRSYLTRSLTDSFEWQMGYAVKYGLFSVDFNDENRPRSPKLSSVFLSKIYETRNVQDVEAVFNATIQELSKPLMYVLEIETAD